MRLVIQSLITGSFLVPDLETAQPVWVRSLRDVGAGLLADYETAHQIFEDHCDFDDGAIVVDLDRLGTVNDYPIN